MSSKNSHCQVRDFGGILLIRGIGILPMKQIQGRAGEWAQESLVGCPVEIALPGGTFILSKLSALLRPRGTWGNRLKTVSPKSPGQGGSS